MPCLPLAGHRIGGGTGENNPDAGVHSRWESHRLLHDRPTERRRGHRNGNAHRAFPLSDSTSQIRTHLALSAKDIARAGGDLSIWDLAKIDEQLTDLDLGFSAELSESELGAN